MFRPHRSGYPYLLRSRRAVFGLCLALLFATSVAARAQATFASTQFALAAGQWNAPASVAVDGVGNLFVADTGNNRIVELPSSASGYADPIDLLDGLSAPAGIAANWNGDLFVADTGNNRILMLSKTASGFAAPIPVASGLAAPAGIAVDSSNNLYVANSGASSVLEIPFAAGSYSAPVVVGTGFNSPLGVAVDAARTLYIADTGNDRIVKQPLGPSGYQTQQILWNNALLAPSGVAVDKSDNLYIADTGNQRVLEETWAAGANRYGSTLIVGSGLASPAAIAVNASGHVFLASTGNNQIFQLQASSLRFGSVAVGSAAAPLTYNFSIAAGATLGGVGIDTQGVAGQDFTDGGATTCLAQTYAAAAVCGVNVSFAPLAPGIRMGAVVLYDGSGNALATAYISGVGQLPRAAFIPGVQTQLATQLSGPTGVAVDGNGDLYIADNGNNRVVELPRIPGSNAYGPQTVVPINGLISPSGVAVDGAGNLYVVSNGNDKVVYLPATPNGFGPQAKVGTGLYGPSNVAVNSFGTVFIADTLDERIDEVAWNGNSFNQELGVGNYHKAPIGLAVDASGNLYFSDPYQNTVSFLPWGGSGFQTQQNLQLTGVAFPIALAVDANQNLYILDAVNNDIVMLTFTGSGFGPQILVASGFNSPAGMTIDGNGVLYVADTGNNRVVRIDLSAAGGMSYQSTYLGSTSADSAQVTLVGNSGNLPLSLNSVAFPADFPQAASSANGCAENIALAGGQWCELAVDFTPVVAGAQLAETVTVVDNSLGQSGTQHPIPVTGTSLALAAQTVAFPAPAAAVYGSAPILLAATASSGLPVAYTVLSGPGVLAANGRYLILAGAGTVVVQASQAGNATFAPAAPVAVSMTVAPATLTVAPQNVSAVYGAIPSQFHYAISGFVRGDNASSALSGQPAISASAPPAAGVGTYSITASAGTLAAANYNFTFASATLTVTPATLQVRAESASRRYGAPSVQLQWNLSGFVNGDGPSAITGQPVLTVAANSGSPVGSYPIQVATNALSAKNYIFAAVGAALYVTPAALTVSGARQIAVYGEPLPAASYSISGFVNGDSAATAVRGVPAIASPAGPHAGAGYYTVSLSRGSLSAANYSFEFVAGSLEIEKAALTVTPLDASMTYGGKLPKLAYAIAGFVNGDTQQSAIAGVPSLSTSANSRSTPGSFAIAASRGSLQARNYTFAFAAGVLSVVKAQILVTPKPATATYGGKLPELSWTFTGFVDGDNESAIQGAPLLVTRATSASPVGTYTISASAGSLASRKYTFEFTDGTLTVSPASLTIAVANQTVAYGSQMPQTALIFSGFVNGDTAATAIAGHAQISTAATASSPVGSYPISIEQGSLAAKNYKFAFKSGTLTVAKARLTLAANNLSMTAGAALPALTFTAKGFVNGDSLASATAGKAALSTAATSSSKAGTYAIDIALGTLTAKNYEFAFVDGTLTVNQ